ncbi:MAG: hypothetical protein OXK82_05530 [Deltaproteobacteria bacterium]|nr:hypothetical protein [Deltaproteobacteria bacterium]
MTTTDMFDTNNVPNRVDAPTVGYLVTNHLNLMYMLSAGLVMPPSGFGEKYYSDTLERFPGWIPVFVDKVPRKAIDHSVKEAGHLKPCILEISLTGLTGRAVALGDAGPRELSFPEQLDGTDRVLFFPAPLPVSRIVSIVFPSADDRRACEADASDYGNVPIGDFKRRTSKPLFTKPSDISWPPRDGPEERHAPLQESLAAGGVMAMLLLFANLGERAVYACRIAFDPDGGASQTAPPILAGLKAWIRDGVVRPPAGSEEDRIDLQNTSQATLFWQAVQRLVKWRNAGKSGSTEDLIIELLSESISGLDPRLKADMSKLRDTLVSLTGLGDATASELFERHDTTLAHALTLFFLRRDCADLFDYESDRITEQDWLAAAILFGVRDGWMSLPLPLRSGRKLSNAVSHRMAGLSHRIAGTDLHLGHPTPRVHSLREAFGDGSAWKSPEKSAALALARLQKWNCVHTRINLGPGEYKLTVRGGSTHIELPGEPRISPEIDIDRFFDLLARTRLDHVIEAEVRKSLPG